MDQVDHHALVGEALGLLIEGLAPFVERTFAQVFPAGTSWIEVMRRKDGLAGRRGGVYSDRDLSLLLRAMTERLGDLGFPFSRSLSRQGQNYASELRGVRNEWAHNQHFSAAAAFRALDSAELLLREIGAAPQAEAVARAKAEVTPSLQPAPATAPRPSEPATVAVEPTPEVPDEASRAGTQIRTEALPVLSYAMAHCQVAVIEDISVEHHGLDARAATLEIEVTCATGSLGGPKVHVLDLIDGQTTTLRSVGLMLDPARMLTLDEQQPGQIVTTLRTAAGQLLASASSDVQVLAHTQWTAQPAQLGMEMLAAHVQPNSASIAPLLLEASDILRSRTGDSSLAGYQSDDPNRVDAIVASIYDAMRARDIRYAEPPASWGGAGQKVRTPQEVLEGRLGTCLDTTVTMAAALEQAGINSTLWLLEGHIFLGYWRLASSLSLVASVEIPEVMNLVDLGSIALVETTLLTGGTESAPFADACHAPKARLTQDLSEVIGVTDIRQARNARIYPLPSRTIGIDGQVNVSIYQPGERPTIEPYRATASEKAAADRSTAPARVGRWKNALLDLSLRNRLINYTERAGYRLEVPGPSIARLEDQVNSNAAITLLASDAVSGVDVARGIRYGRDLPDDDREQLLAESRSAYIDITAASYKTKLRYLAYKAKTVVEETGSNNLYLAFGMLRWQIGARDLRSPLVLVPVTLSTTSRGETYRITVDDAGNSTPNYCLLEKLRVTFGLDIPGLQNPDEDASGIDLPAAFDAARHALVDAGLPFRVEEAVELAILQFAKFPLWKDIDENWQTLASNSLVRHLVHTPLDRYTDPAPEQPAVDLDELGTLVPVPADSSQLDAVAAAVAGRTFVLEGPPGTGKSQTITNLLARSLAAGRRVLFVAEKRAALDVVKARLDEVGLSHLSLDLHDKAARPAAVRAQIKAALDLNIRADLDALKANTESAEAARHRLGLYAERLHETNCVGHSLYSARAFDLGSERDIPAIDIPDAVLATMSAEQVDNLKRGLRRVPDKADLARPAPQHPWRFLDERALAVDPSVLHAAATELDRCLALAAPVPADLLEHLTAPDDLRPLAQLTDAPRLPLGAVDALHNPAWRDHLDALRHQLDLLAKDTATWRAVVSPTAMNLDIPAIHAAAQAADASSIFGRSKRRRAAGARLGDSLLVPPGSIDLKSLSTLTGQLSTMHGHVQDVRTKTLQIPLPLTDASWNPAVPEHAAATRDALNWLIWLGDQLTPDGSHLREDRRAFYASTTRGALRTELTLLTDAWEALLTSVPLDPNRVRTWCAGAGFLTTWRTTRARRDGATPATLHRWLDLLTALEPLRLAGLAQARDDLLDGRAPADDAAIALDRGVALASVRERLAATGLDDFSLANQQRAIDRFTTANRDVRAELPRAIPQAIVAARRFSATSATGQIGGLTHQLGRQRGGMGVRSLMANYGDLIAQITPCMLMSPESVARFFPARPDLFDIVVFDEASQIRVADAIGAMGRATSVVVVGDSKQMPPTQFAEVSADIDEEQQLTAEDVTDEESILTECVQAQVPSRWLSWHYRSQDESLIAFSNRHYYEDRLSSFPAPLPQDPRTHPDGYGISLVRVDGTFERAERGHRLRTNPVEAHAIVDDVRQRFAASPNLVPSLGIITFNAQQRDLIENLLRDCDDERIPLALDQRDGLFVKNLENVQGDERDCILFSVAFSANDKGVVPLNFGPLSKPGGQRRLNVAITRARRQVVLYASFDPSALRAEETTQIGTKHLKAYLELAARGVDAIRDDRPTIADIDRHRDEIADALRAAGHAVRTGVGLSGFRIDLTIADATQPDKPLLAVLLDGPAWRARRTVADRDGLPVDVLRSMMRWPGVERVWLPEWMRDQEAVLTRLTTALDAARSADQHRPEPPTSEPTPARHPADHVSLPSAFEAGLLRSSQFVTPSTAPTAGPHPHATPYIPWRPSPLGDRSILDDLPARRPSEQVRDAAHRAIEAEGPIHPDRLARLVAAAFGLTRVNEERKSAILRAVGRAYRVEDGECFYWPADVDPTTWHFARQPGDGEPRTLADIPLVEIANAIHIVCEVSGGATAEDAKREALHHFGGRRLTDNIGDRLDKALRYAVRNGYVERGDDGVHRAVRR